MAAAAIIAAAISAAATAYSSDQQNSNELIGQAGRKPGGGTGGGTTFTPSADQFKKFSPGVSGSGDGSMPVKADISGGLGGALGMQPQLEGQFAGPPGSVFTPQADFRQSLPESSGSASSPTQLATGQPSLPQTPQGGDAQNAIALAQAGASLAQAFRAPDLQPGPVAQVGGAGYQPTAMQALAAMAARKRQMGY